MKKHLALGTMAFMLMAAAASAAESEQDGYRLFEFDFTCQFDRDHAASELPSEPDVTTNDDHDFGHCSADAKVFAYVRPDDWMSTMQSARRIANKLAVRCDDNLIYADSAILSPERRFVAITGISGYPAIFVERRGHEAITATPDPYTAFLTFGRRPLKGTCNVRSEPVWGHEVDSSAMSR